MDLPFDGDTTSSSVASSCVNWYSGHIDTSSGNGVFMGGFYSTHGELGPGCTFTTLAHDAKYHDYSTGFRCCADVLSRSAGTPG